MFQVVALLINVAIALLFRPKTPDVDPASHDLNSIPTAGADRPIPVAFGTVVIKGANVVWYGDLYMKVLKKKGSKGK